MPQTEMCLIATLLLAVACATAETLADVSETLGTSAPSDANQSAIRGGQHTRVPWHGTAHSSPSGDKDRRLMRQRDCRGYASMRFVVPPREGQCFLGAWLKLMLDVRKAGKGMEVFELDRSRLDNNVFVSYGEWARVKDLRRHMGSRHFREFENHTARHGVMWELQPLQSLCGQRQAGCGLKAELSKAALATLAQGANHEQVMRLRRELHGRRDMEHVLLHITVPPGQADAFNEAWLDVVGEVLDERGNRLYSLRKAATDNTRYYIRGIWKGHDAFQHHFSTHHMHKFRSQLANRGIVWVIQPLVSLGQA